MSLSFPVFIGSTYEDLQPYRYAVRETLHKLEAVVRGMEYFGSQPGTPKEECLKSVRSCRVYVGIFAMRYGSIDAETGKSFTHLEYEEAQRVGLPSLIYLLDEDRQPVLPKFVDTGENAAKLEQLKTELKRRFVISFFTTPEDLARRIAQDLPATATQIGVEVRRSELARIIEDLPRVDWLNEERLQFLKRELGTLAQSFPNESILREALEFLLAGDRQAAVFLLARTSRLDVRQVIDLLIEVEKIVAGVIARGNLAVRHDAPETRS